MQVSTVKKWNKKNTHTHNVLQWRVNTDIVIITYFIIQVAASHSPLHQIFPRLSFHDVSGRLRGDGSKGLGAERELGCSGYW